MQRLFVYHAQQARLMHFVMFPSLAYSASGGDMT